MTKKKTKKTVKVKQQAEQLARPSLKFNSKSEREAYITGLMDGIELHANGMVEYDGPPKKIIQKIQKKKKTLGKTK